VKRSFLVCAIFFGTSNLSAGPLSPPLGPVASTHKTLTEIEPRIAINATNTPGDPIGDPSPSLFKITQPGSYYLTSNITGVVGKHGIEIAASGVTLDLNGFELRGVPAIGAFDGVTVTVIPPQALGSIAVVNGSVSEWGDEGIDLGIGIAFNSRVDGVRAIGNAGNGVSVPSGSTVTNCVTIGNSSNGIQTSSNCTVWNCTATNNGGGISVSEGCAVIGCTVRSSSGIGISALSNCTISSCSVNRSGSNGILADSGSTVSNCSANSNTGHGISVGEGCTIHGCTARFNTLGGIFTSIDCSITDCTIAANQSFGIRAGSRCAILKTTASSTTAGPGILATSEGLRIEGCSINNNSTFGVTVDTFSNIAELAVVNCTIRGNGSAGISSEASTQVLDSVISSNASGMILTGSCLVRGCTITSNTDSGIELTGNANVVMNNTLTSNAVTLATSAGILVQGTDNTIDANRLFSNVQGGIKVNTSGNLVLRNYLARTGATITAVAGNAVAQTLSPGAGFISTDPNANLSY
jgi:parallel beta-helix repeat protein